MSEYPQIDQTLQLANKINRSREFMAKCKGGKVVPKKWGYRGKVDGKE